MRYFSHINSQSAINRRWRTHNQVSGILDNVVFNWNIHTHRYESLELTEEQTERFRLRTDHAVVLEAVGIVPEAGPEPVVKRTRIKAS
jgi:hypothetical protein